MGIAEDLHKKYGYQMLRSEFASLVSDVLELAAQVADEKALNSVSETAEFCAKTIAARIRKMGE